MDTTLTFVSIEKIKLACENGIEAILFERKKMKEKAIFELMKPRKVWFKLKSRTIEEAENDLKRLENDIYSKYWNISLFKENLFDRLKLLLKSCIISNEKFCLLSLEDTEIICRWEQNNRFNFVKEKK
jgi:hypothetical protein